MINKTRALELASERKKSADLEANQRVMARRIQELEESFSKSSPGTNKIPTPVRRSVRISERPSTHSSPTNDKEYESMDTDEAEFNDSDMDSKHSTNDNSSIEEAHLPRAPSKTNQSARSADDLQVLDGIE